MKRKEKRKKEKPELFSRSDTIVEICTALRHENLIEIQ